MATFEHYKTVVPAGFALLTFRHTMAGLPDEVICTLGATGVSGAPTGAVLSGIGDAWEANVVALMSNAVTFEKITASDAGGVYEEVLYATSGSNAGAFSPISCCAIAEKVTGISGRRNRGRMYLPVVLESVVDQAGNMTDAYRDGVRDAMEDFRTDCEALDGGLLVLQILHSKGWDGNVEPADPGNAPGPTSIQSFKVGTKIGTQRRRIR